MQETFGGTPVMGWLYRALGAKIGQQVFLGGLIVVEFDALEVGDYCAAATRSKVYGLDADGTVVAVKIEK